MNAPSCSAVSPLPNFSSLRRTRCGRIVDGANSAFRYIFNIFFDHRRQEAVDLLLSGKSNRHSCHIGRSATRRGRGGNVRFPSSALDLDLWAQVREFIYK